MVDQVRAGGLDVGHLVHPDSGVEGHVAISLGDGRTVEAWRTGEPVQVKRLAGRRWTSAGLVPGLVYLTRRTAPTAHLEVVG